MQLKKMTGFFFCMCQLWSSELNCHETRIVHRNLKKKIVTTMELSDEPTHKISERKTMSLVLERSFRRGCAKRLHVILISWRMHVNGFRCSWLVWDWQLDNSNNIKHVLRITNVMSINYVTEWDHHFGSILSGYLGYSCQLGDS